MKIFTIAAVTLTLFTMSVMSVQAQARRPAGDEKKKTEQKPQVDEGVPGAEFGQPRHHPVIGEGGGDREGDMLIGGPALERQGRAADMGQPHGDIGEEALAVGRQRHPAMAAQEE